jgi:hypothetical protein
MSGLPTSLDLMHATMYAMDRIQKEKCKDPDILKEYPGLLWQPQEQYRIYPCPPGVEACEHGKCRIASGSTCNAVSQLPYDNVTGEKLPSMSCKKNDDCKIMPYNSVCLDGKDGKTCQPKYQYVEWRASTGTSPSASLDPGGLCMFGNFALRRWCEVPEQRRPESERGITDVPPFKYDSDTGKCSITRDYCKWMGVDYEASDKYGRPNCYETTGQKIAEEFFLGRTIFRGIKKLFEGFNSIPEKAEKLADDRYIESKKLLFKNFAGAGIHLYQFLWKEDAVKLDYSTRMPTCGFLSEEIESVYPELVQKKNGVKFIVITRKQIKREPKLKRIYVTVGGGRWMLDYIMSTAGPVMKKMKEKGLPLS